MKMYRLCFRRKTTYRHRCLLIGVVTSGRPAAYYNRRVIRISHKSIAIDPGTFGGVKQAGGKIEDIELLGRVRVRLEDHLHIVEQWTQESLKECGKGKPEEVVAGVKIKMAQASIPTSGKTMDIDIFRAVIVNHLEDQVFAYKKPSSSY
jgi:hypothetical protein